ncbi:MAG: eCIS core domain-containing protein, partial [Candidatus Angelobacter sp.]
MATAARTHLPAPLPAPPPKTTKPVPPPRSTRTSAAVSRRLAPALRMGAASPADNLPMAVAQRQGSSGGQPLAPAVRMAMEDSYQVDMQGVRVHSDSRAQEAAASLSARAFTHGSNIVLGRGESATDLELMAHEGAHVVQQQGAPTIQHYTPGGGDSYEHEAHKASAAVVRGETFQVQQRTSPRAQRWGLSDIRDYIADKANIIPGFRMFTIVLGVNPINGSDVDRSPANVLRAIIEFIPFGGLITQALDNYGIFDKIGNWVSQQIASLGMVGSAIVQAVTDFIHSLGPSDFLHPGDAWERAKLIFTGPIDQLISFAKG